MKRLIIVLFFFFSLNSFAQDTTNYYFIRHAEKDRTDPSNVNPRLTPKGQLRAVKWSEVFQEVSFDAVYSTDYSRTIETALPTSNAKNLKLIKYDADMGYSLQFQKQTRGKTVLIVGHSNTIPQFVNAVLNEERYPQIEDDENSNLYIVTFLGNKANSVLLKIE
ncbi:phosphoglycerate mutase family protein [Flavobacteriaceae bacterium]|nr:phosphoglycerate mutase family protein [Flavobacteriaceae bacterium]